MPDHTLDKPTCFVIQSFDGGTFDRRYRETIHPGLVRAGVEPQRADEILGLNPIIEKIETAIESASICIAEVSEDNPNVWLELGYALALRRPTVILCDKSARSKLPFDVQHRPVILYRSDSKSGFDELEADIVKWVTHELETEQRIAQAPTLRFGSEDAADLGALEVAILSTAFSFVTTTAGGVTNWELEKKLTIEGYNAVGMALGVVKLIDREYLSEGDVDDADSYEGKIKQYRVTPSGIAWIVSHEDLLEVRNKTAKAPVEPLATNVNDDVPF